jgi:hypothetical protein
VVGETPGNRRASGASVRLDHPLGLFNVSRIASADRLMTACSHVVKSGVDCPQPFERSTSPVAMRDCKYFDDQRARSHSEYSAIPGVRRCRAPVVRQQPTIVDGRILRHSCVSARSNQHRVDAGPRSELLGSTDIRISRPMQDNERIRETVCGYLSSLEIRQESCDGEARAV